MKKLKEESVLKARYAGMYQHIEQGENSPSHRIDRAKSFESFLKNYFEKKFSHLGCRLVRLILLTGNNPEGHCAEYVNGQGGDVNHPQVVQVADNFLEVERNFERNVVIETRL